MTWLIRFLAWATLLSIPCFFLMNSYQGALAGAAMAILASLGFPMRLELKLQEPFNLGIFAAMCLASMRAPARERWRAIAVGLPVLALFGLVAVVAVLGGYRVATGSHGAEAGVTGRWILSALETIPWVSAPALWLALLGWRELPKSLLRRRSS